MLTKVKIDEIENKNRSIASYVRPNQKEEKKQRDREIETERHTRDTRDREISERRDMDAWRDRATDAIGREEKAAA